MITQKTFAERCLYVQNRTPPTRTKVILRSENQKREADMYGKIRNPIAGILRLL